MKQFLLWVAVVGLATTGCAQNRVFAPQTTRANRASAGMRVARSPSMSRSSQRSAQREQLRGGVELAAFGGRGGDDACCGDCCAGGCCDAGCATGCCGDGGCTGGAGNGCSDCGGKGCGMCQRLAGRLNPHAGGYPEAQNFNPSPPTGQTAYPYYTVKGPRDFLRNNPPSTGPY